MGTIGIRVNQLREAHGLDVGQLQYKSGLSAAHIYRIEDGARQNLSADTLTKLADGLNTSVDFLLGRTDDPSPPTRAKGQLYKAELELFIRRQLLADTVSRQPEARQRRVLDGMLLLLEVMGITDDAITQENILPSPGHVP